MTIETKIGTIDTDTFPAVETAPMDISQELGPLVTLDEAEPVPEDFTELEGTVELNPNVFVLATHGRAEPVPEDGISIPYYKKFGRILRRNFSDFATYGTRKKPGLTRFFSKDRMLKKPPNPRVVGDSGRSSDELHYTPISSGEKVDKKDTIRSADFLLNQVFSRDLSKEQMEQWLDAKHGPREYHREVKERHLQALRESEGPVLVFDFHDTDEWGVLDATDERATDIVYRTDEDGWSAGFPLAVLSDLNGEATGKHGYADIFQEELVHAYKENGVEPGKTHTKRVPVKSEDGSTKYEEVVTKLWGDVEVNSRFKGGYITRLLGVELREELIAAGEQELADKIVVFQVELNRSNLLDTVTQEIDCASAYIEATILAQAMNALSDRVTADYLSRKKKQG